MLFSNFLEGRVVELFGSGQGAVGGQENAVFLAVLLETFLI